MRKEKEWLLKNEREGKKKSGKGREGKGNGKKR